MALLPYADETKVPEKTREILNRGRVKMNVARMIANSDAAFYPFSMLGNSLLTRSKLDARLRELAILHTAKVSKSVYEWTQHVPIAKSAGVTEEQVGAIENWESAQCFSDLDRLVLKFTDEVARNVKGSRQTLDALKKHMGATEIVELVMSVGFWGMVARVLETTEVDLEEFAGKIDVLKNSFTSR
ncbi:MAG TPA: carboxymuconolactone decarboxylase family protein [Candidatus Binataceae bacterium]|nr:carboxymuconolactone decarboxylase family protein [Candidatus Binataceae bacterium]